MLAEEEAAAYEETTDGCRHSSVGTRDTARQWQRVKPDKEVHPLAELDWEKEPTWNELMPQATPLRASACA